MKLQIVLLVLSAITLCSSSEKIKGRLSNIRNEQLLRNEEDNPTRGRLFFHKKGGQSSGPASIFLIALPMGGSGDNGIEEEFEIVGNFDVEVADAANATRADYDDDYLDSEDEVDNEYQTSIRNKKRNSNFQLKKSNGKKQAQRFAVPSSIKKSSHRLQMVRLNGNNNVNRNSDNIAVLRRLFIQSNKKTE